MPGRVSVYHHSDRVSKDKGAALARVTCVTDFAANTDEFGAFAQRVAMLAYGLGVSTWADLATAMPDLEISRAALAKTLRETIAVTDITILSV